MTNVYKVFKEYSKLNCLDLLTEVPGLSFSWYDPDKDKFYFEASNPEGMISLLTDCFGPYRYDSKGIYYYQDGTKAKYIISRRCYEFKKYKQVIAQVKIS